MNNQDLINSILTEFSDFRGKKSRNPISIYDTEILLIKIWQFDGYRSIRQ